MCLRSAGNNGVPFNNFSKMRRVKQFSAVLIEYLDDGIRQLVDRTHVKKGDEVGALDTQTAIIVEPEF